MPSTSRHARFAVSDCPRLQTLRIGDDSFADFSQFSLKHLSALKEVTVGDRCFVFISKMEMINLPKLETLELGEKTFMGMKGRSCEVIMEDLESLASFTAKEETLLYVKKVDFK
ncbi:hypothetical protein WA577_000315, partial [Blastocystis sp. JDR]